MAKQKSKKKDRASENVTHDHEQSSIIPSTLDPTLNALFQDSLENSEKVPEQRYEVVVRPSSREAHSRTAPNTNGGEQTREENQEPKAVATDSKRKRKRKVELDDVEGNYMKRLELEQLKSEAKKQKRAPEVEADSEAQASDQENDSDGSSPSQASADVKNFEADDVEIPQHESLAGASKGSELEKADRTVFLSNVASAAITSKEARRQLMNHLSSFFDKIKHQDKPPKIESIRFRSTAFASSAIPKKAAFAKKEVMDATTKSSNAYAVYNTIQAAREAVKRLNATVVLERHIRVDSVAHPSPVDNRRCVFVGNLGFVDDESLIKAAESGDTPKPTKPKQAGDVEEGLWRQFMKAGRVESVRVVRDKATRVGKGFAYVQFQDPNSVERALAFNEKRFPPLLPRTLRVTRAKNISKTTSRLQKGRTTESRPSAIYNPKHSAEELTVKGRAKKLLGQSGSMAFEGTRAKRGSGNKLGKPLSKSKGKPQTRSSRRGAAYKAAKRG